MKTLQHRRPGKQSGLERTRRIWKGIIQYANAENKNASENLRRVLNQLTPEPPEFDQLEGYEDIPSYAKSASSNPSVPDLENAFQVLAARYQNDLRNLLKWMCAPKDHPELRIDALQFLESNAHGHHWRLCLDDDPIEDFDDWHIFFLKEVEYTSIMSPICEFIFDRIEDVHGSIELDEAVPIRICKRPGCGKFILPEKTGRKKYCSNLCCSLDHENKKPREERTDYAWLHRLEKESLGVLRTKTKEPAAKKRLHDVEARWPNLAEKVRAIRARV